MGLRLLHKQTLQADAADYANTAESSGAGYDSRGAAV
jgi:hypothetical protein